MITDIKGNKDVLKLNKVAEDRTYASFSVSLDNKITVSMGECQISILLIENHVAKNSQVINLNLTYDNFTLSQRIQWFDSISKDVAKKLYQIEQMTQMNIDIYQQIEEEIFK